MHKRKITFAYIRSVVDKAENDLEGCLSMLDPAHSNKRGEILAFQPRLLRSLVEAEVVYREIKQERKMLIGRKADLSETWFRRRMAKLDQYRKCLRIVLGAGRSIGDGFAWIFYRQERSLIDQHMKLQRQPLLPPGLGGMGESLFLDRFQTAAGSLAIYHGTTSILRLGDFSFYDPIGGSVVGMGELKTAREGDGTVQLQMQLIAQRPSMLASSFQADKNGSIVPRASFSQAHKERLARQLTQIVSAFKEAESRPESIRISVDKKLDFSKLQAVMDLSPSEHVKYETVGKGLLLVAVACPGSIFERELGRGAAKWKPPLDRLAGETMKILCAEAPDNSLLISSMAFSHEHQPLFLPGTAPLCWWPLTQRQKSDLIFGRIMLFSLYNPSHFVEVFKSRGYSVVLGPRGELKSVTKQLPEGRSIVLENFSFFQDWAMHYLLDEEVLNSLIGTLERETQDSCAGRIQLNPQLLM